MANFFKKREKKENVLREIMRAEIRGTIEVDESRGGRRE